MTVLDCRTGDASTRSWTADGNWIPLASSVSTAVWTVRVSECRTATSHPLATELRLTHRPTLQHRTVLANPVRVSAADTGPLAGRFGQVTRTWFGSDTTNLSDETCARAAHAIDAAQDASSYPTRLDDLLRDQDTARAEYTLLAVKAAFAGAPLHAALEWNLDLHELARAHRVTLPGEEALPCDPANIKAALDAGWAVPTLHPWLHDTPSGAALGELAGRQPMHSDVTALARFRDAGWTPSDHHRLSVSSAGAADPAWLAVPPAEAVRAFTAGLAACEAATLWSAGTWDTGMLDALAALRVSSVP